MQKLFSFILAAIIIFPNLTLAQITENIADGAEIKLNPAYPQPLESFTATIDDYSLISTVSEINWVVNGKEITADKNKRAIEIKAGPVGKAISISALLKLTDGSRLTVKANPIPLYADIIIEPQTRTPNFYQGRALPSIDSTVNATLLINGLDIDQNNLIYTWRLNNQALDGGSTRGRFKTSLVVPQGQVFLLTVEATKLNGELLFRQTIEIPTASPKLLFYETNSLYGTKNIAFTKTGFTGDSITVKAEPYNLDIRTFNNPDLIEWSIDNRKTSNTAFNPYEITLMRGGGISNQSRVGLHVRNLTTLIQGAEEEFTLIY